MKGALLPLAASSSTSSSFSSRSSSSMSPALLRAIRTGALAAAAAGAATAGAMSVGMERREDRDAILRVGGHPGISATDVEAWSGRSQGRSPNKASHLNVVDTTDATDDEVGQPEGDRFQLCQNGGF